MATGLDVDVRVDDDRVLDESRQQLRGQKIRREDHREPAHVAEGGVDMQRVHHALEISREVSQSVWVPASKSW